MMRQNVDIYGDIRVTLALLSSKTHLIWASDKKTSGALNAMRNLTKPW